MLAVPPSPTFSVFPCFFLTFNVLERKRFGEGELSLEQMRQKMIVLLKKKPQKYNQIKKETNSRINQLNIDIIKLTDDLGVEIGTDEEV